MLGMTPEPEPARWKQSPSHMRAMHKCRTMRLARQVPLMAIMRERGYLVGKFGGRKSQCPVRDGPEWAPSHLHYAWMEGYIRGWNEYAKLRPDRPSPRRRSKLRPGQMRLAT